MAGTLQLSVPGFVLQKRKDEFKVARPVHEGVVCFALLLFQRGEKKVACAALISLAV